MSSWHCVAPTRSQEQDGREEKASVSQVLMPQPTALRGALKSRAQASLWREAPGQAFMYPWLKGLGPRTQGGKGHSVVLSPVLENGPSSVSEASTIYKIANVGFPCDGNACGFSSAGPMPDLRETTQRPHGRGPQTSRRQADSGCFVTSFKVTLKE